jgi:hypothetical protein
MDYEPAAVPPLADDRRKCGVVVHRVAALHPHAHGRRRENYRPTPADAHPHGLVHRHRPLREAWPHSIPPHRRGAGMGTGRMDHDGIGVLRPETLLRTDVAGVQRGLGRCDGRAHTFLVGSLPPASCAARRHETCQQRSRSDHQHAAHGHPSVMPRATVLLRPSARKLGRRRRRVSRFARAAWGPIAPGENPHGYQGSTPEAQVEAAGAPGGLDRVEMQSGGLLAAPVAARSLDGVHRGEQTLRQGQRRLRLEVRARVSATAARPASMLPGTETCSPARSPHLPTELAAMCAAARPCRPTAWSWRTPPPLSPARALSKASAGARPRRAMASSAAGPR